MKKTGIQSPASALIDGMDLEKMPASLDSVQNVQYVEYRSNNQLNGSGDYIDLSKSMLHVKSTVMEPS